MQAISPPYLTLNDFASLEGDKDYVPDNDDHEDEDANTNHTDTNHQNPDVQEEPVEEINNPRMGKPCGPKCRKKCWDKISEERRKEVFHTYWIMTYTEKRSFIFHMVSQGQTARLTSTGPSRRRKSLAYHITDDLGKPQDVCKTFFLTTLGYHLKNDRLINTVISNTTPSSLSPPQERCGKHAPFNKIGSGPNSWTYWIILPYNQPLSTRACPQSQIPPKWHHRAAHVQSLEKRRTLQNVVMKPTER